MSLQPTKASDLLLQTVIPEEPVKNIEPAPTVIESNAPALMQESEECPILEEEQSPILDSESKLESSMSSSRTTLVSTFEPSSLGSKLDSTLTEEDQETTHYGILGSKVQ